MSSEPIVLPAAAAEPRRPPVPFVAAVVPVAAGVILWLVTGSFLALCFALLGPLMIGGSLLDGARHRRRESRRLRLEADAAWERVEKEIAERVQQETERLWRRHPDVAHCLTTERVQEDSGADAVTPVVIGRGARPSELRLSGGDGERARVLRQRTRSLDAAPIVVPLGRGVCIRAPRVVGIAIARALVTQLCLRFLPGRLALVEPLPEEWGFAHARATSRGAMRLSFATDPGVPSAADATIWVCEPGESVPEGITTVIDWESPSKAVLLTPHGTQSVVVECLSAAQTAAIARESASRATAQVGLPEHVRLADLPISLRRDGLAAVIGRHSDADAILDLVADGPHAVVTGMTGSGKSELLVSWVVSIAAAHGPEEVVFVLADFKGGTAFDALRGLPQVTAVLTDLDDDSARRGVRSLTAELRRRERALAELGARDIASPGVRMPRLVIVVDEFAALLQEHADLAAVFTDIAARGRALGMHLILGTQRAAGVVRDALAANCPLRISLRVTDPADSRMVIGSADAAELEGGHRTRGIAFVRRPQDVEAGPVRVALTGPEDLRQVGARWANASRPPGPWLPALPRQLGLRELEPTSDGGVILGLADEPDMQRQSVVILRPGRDRGMSVIGGPGSGKSAVLRTIARQHTQAIVIPADPERAWDMIGELESLSGRIVLCDDVDQLLAAFPHDYAMAAAERLERFIRAGDGCTIVLTAARVSGATARLVDALPERMLLRVSTRGEHLAAGGESDSFRRDRPPGRGHLAGSEVQVAWTDPGGTGDPDAAFDPWRPRRRLVGVVVNAGARLAETVREALPEWEIEVLGAAPGGSGSVGSPRGGDPAAGVVLIGDGESWQRDWARCQRVKAEGEVLVLAECATELRTLMGVRELPPYARTHAGRAWRLLDGYPPERVVLPAPRTRRHRA